MLKIQVSKLYAISSLHVQWASHLNTLSIIRLNSHYSYKNSINDMNSIQIRIPVLWIPIAGGQDDAVRLSEPSLSALCWEPEYRTNELACGRFTQSGCSARRTHVTHLAHAFCRWSQFRQILRTVFGKFDYLYEYSLKYQLTRIYSKICEHIEFTNIEKSQNTIHILVHTFIIYCTYIIMYVCMYGVYTYLIYVQIFYSSMSLN